MIEANGVIKSYGLGGSKTDVLKGVDLQISNGDFAVILEIGRASCRERV